MGLRSWLFATTYDRVCRRVEDAGLRDLRAELLARARGDVVEVGAGTGTNLEHYGAGVGSLTLTEPDRTMMRHLRRAAEGHALSPTLHRTSAEEIPLADHSVDTVVSTLVLCGVDDPRRAVAEIRRILRPDGQLLVLEHVRSDDPAVARQQERMNRLNRLLAGCECTRRTASTLRDGGFDTSALGDREMPAAPIHVRPLVVGAAAIA